jgi:diguanylate cyclase
MKRKYSLRFLLFVWIFRVIGLGIVSLAIQQIHMYDSSIWLDFFVWTTLLVIARVGGLFTFIGLKASAGWANSIEFAAALILPFPLFCAAMVLSFIIIVGKRMAKKHPEPVLGPDVNAGSVIMGALLAMIVYTKVQLMLENTVFESTVALLCAALIFGAFLVFTVTSVISLHENKKWVHIGTLTPDSLITEAVVILSGALLGKVYLLDSSLLLLLLIPLVFMHSMLKRINETKLIYIDEKTGLHNYRYFDESLNKMFEQAKTHHQPLSLIFGDMDYLRDVNNNYGHQAGDKAIVAIGSVFKNAVDSNMVAARFGGEEFVLIVPNQSKYKAQEIAEEVRKKIHSLELEVAENKKINVSMSFGVASYPEDAKTIEELIKKADETLYDAKHAGRNRVSVYNERIKQMYEENFNSSSGVM